VSGPTAKVGSQSPLRGGGAPSTSTAPREKKRRLLHSDGPPLSGQQALGKATAPQPDPKAAATTVSNGSDGGGSAATVKEVAAAATAAAKQAAEAMATEEAVTAPAAAVLARCRRMLGGLPMRCRTQRRRV
jgi:hypothetical protein